MKKVSLLALALSTTMATTVSAEVIAPVMPAAAPCAAAPCPCPKAFQGFAFGGNIGYGIGASNLRSTIATPTDAVTSSSTTPNTAYQGVDGGVLVGYTHRFNNFALGLDFYANWTNASGSASSGSTTGGVTTTDTSKVSLQNTLDLRATFGYVINNLVMPKIMLGWENAQYKIATTPASSMPTLGSQSASKRLNGFLWGAGVDFLVAKNVVMGLEYTGVALSKQTATYTGVSASGIPATLTTKIQPAAYNKFAATIKFVY